MVVIPFDHPAHGKIDLRLHGLIRLTPGIGHIRHDQNAQFVRPVQLSRHLDLDVDSLTVQAKTAGAQDFIPHKIIGWKAVIPFWMIGLVQRRLQIDRFVVERDVGNVCTGKIHHTDLSHAEIGGYRITDSSRIVEHDLDLIEVGIFQRPETGFRKRNIKFDFGLSALYRLCEFNGIPVFFFEMNRNGGIFGSFLIQYREYQDFPFVNIGCKMHGFQICRRSRFEIDGLPDSPCIAVSLFSL